MKGYGNDSLFLTGFTNSGNKSVQSSLSWKDNNYHIFPFSVINSYNGKELCSTFLAINTSDIVKDYRSYLWRLLGFSSVFLVVLFFVLQLLFRLPLGVIQDLKNNVEREVTNRSKAIIDTNRELNQIFNSTANGLRIIDPNYDVIRVNDAYCKIFGIEKDEVEGKKCHGDDFVFSAKLDDHRDRTKDFVLRHPHGGSSGAETGRFPLRRICEDQSPGYGGHSPPCGGSVNSLAGNSRQSKKNPNRYPKAQTFWDAGLRNCNN